MSSDNYIFIRKWHGQFAVTNESASMDEPGKVRDGDKRFETLQEAWDYAGTLYSEYGVECDFPVAMTVTEAIGNRGVPALFTEIAAEYEAEKK